MITIGPSHEASLTMQVNNLYITGRFQHHKQDETFSWTTKQLLLFDNKIILKKNSFYLTPTKNIRQILKLHNLQKILWQWFRIEIGAKIHHMKWKIGIIHKSLMIPCSLKAITCEFLPCLRNEIGIDKIYVTQEQNTPLSADLDEVIRNGEHLPFIALKINSQDKNTSIKMQLGKECKTAQITLILSKFTEETKKLIHFLEHYKQEK